MHPPALSHHNEYINRWVAMLFWQCNNWNQAKEISVRRPKCCWGQPCFRSLTLPNVTSRRYIPPSYVAVCCSPSWTTYYPVVQHMLGLYTDIINKEYPMFGFLWLVDLYLNNTAFFAYDILVTKRELITVFVEMITTIFFVITTRNLFQSHTEFW